MAIHVTANNLVGGTFPDATGWHVDDNGYLHVTKTGHGNLATYHADQWVSVERVEDGK